MICLASKRCLIFYLPCVLPAVFGERKLKMEPPGRSKSGKPKRRFMELMKEHMQRVGVTEVDANPEAMGPKTVTYL